jgi:hypothetical protein
MADNLNVPGVGNVATDEISSVHYQRVKVVHGADNSETDTSTAAPFPVGGSLLTAIDTDTSNLAAALAQTNDPATGTAKGIPNMAVRDDALTDLGVADNDWAPQRVNQRGATWTAQDTTLDATNDAVAIDARAGVGFDHFHSVSLTADEQVKGSAGTVGNYYAANKHATEWRYVRFYDALAASVTVGTAATVQILALPPASGANLATNWKFGTGITVAATKDQSDSGTTLADANDVILSLGYK